MLSPDLLVGVLGGLVAALFIGWRAHRERLAGERIEAARIATGLAFRMVVAARDRIGPLHEHQRDAAARLREAHRTLWPEGLDAMARVALLLGEVSDENRDVVFAFGRFVVDSDVAARARPDAASPPAALVAQYRELLARFRKLWGAMSRFVASKTATTPIVTFPEWDPKDDEDDGGEPPRPA